MSEDHLSELKRRMKGQRSHTPEPNDINLRGLDEHEPTDLPETPLASLSLFSLLSIFVLVLTFISCFGGFLLLRSFAQEFALAYLVVFIPVSIAIGLFYLYHLKHHRKFRDMILGEDAIYFVPYNINHKIKYIPTRYIKEIKLHYWLCLEIKHHVFKTTFFYPVMTDKAESFIAAWYALQQDLEDAPDDPPFTAPIEIEKAYIAPIPEQLQSENIILTGESEEPEDMAPGS